MEAIDEYARCDIKKSLRMNQNEAGLNFAKAVMVEAERTRGGFRVVHLRN